MKVIVRPLTPALFPALEADPLDRAHTTSTSFTGFAPTFERAGFELVARRVPARPIMRHVPKRSGR